MSEFNFGCREWLLRWQGTAHMRLQFAYNRKQYKSDALLMQMNAINFVNNYEWLSAERQLGCTSVTVECSRVLNTSIQCPQHFWVFVPVRVRHWCIAARAIVRIDINLGCEMGASIPALDCWGPNTICTSDVRRRHGTSFLQQTGTVSVYRPHINFTNCIVEMISMAMWRPKRVVRNERNLQFKNRRRRQTATLHDIRSSSFKMLFSRSAIKPGDNDKCTNEICISKNSLWTVLNVINVLACGARQTQLRRL